MAKLILNASDVPNLVTSVTIGSANNFTTGVASKPSTRSKHVIRNLRVEGNKKTLYIRSNRMDKRFGVWVRENGVLPIERTDDEALFQALKHVEKKVNAELHRTNGDMEKVRPLYSPEKETAWIKLALDVEAFTWDGERIPKPFHFGNGSYQLIIRATNLYCGEHGTLDYKYSVMFKVFQIRYLEETATFLFDQPKEGNDDGETAVLISSEEEEAAPTAAKKAKTKKETKPAVFDRVAEPSEEM